MEVPESHTNAEFYSAFANAAYGETNEERQEKLAAQDIEGWEIDEELSNVDRQVYTKENKKGGHDVILANRGTSQTRNILPDIGIMFGAEGNTKRYRDLKTDYARMKEKYSNSNDNFATTGHSLGGNQGVYLNRKYGIESHTFNPGASLSHMKQGFVKNLACWAMPSWSDCKQADKSTIYHTPGDPLSTASIFDRDHKEIHKRKSGQYNVHSLYAFLKNPDN